jgi:hypothetical protein
VNTFPEQLKCPDLVEPQIIVRGKYTHNRANGKGTGCHPQHECLKRRGLRRTSYFHTDWSRASDCAIRGGANRLGRFGEPPLPIFILAQNNNAVNDITHIRFCVCCGERFVADEYRFDDLLSQMSAPFQNRVKAFAARPFRTISEHSGRICVIA